MKKRLDKNRFRGSQMDPRMLQEIKRMKGLLLTPLPTKLEDKTEETMGEALWAALVYGVMGIPIRLLLRWQWLRNTPSVTLGKQWTDIVSNPWVIPALCGYLAFFIVSALKTSAFRAYRNKLWDDIVTGNILHTLLKSGNLTPCERSYIVAVSNLQQSKTELSGYTKTQVLEELNALLKRFREAEANEQRLEITSDQIDRQFITSEQSSELAKLESQIEEQKNAVSQINDIAIGILRSEIIIENVNYSGMQSPAQSSSPGQFVTHIRHTEEAVQEMKNSL